MKKRLPISLSIAAFVAGSLWVLGAQEPQNPFVQNPEASLAVSHPECTMFGPLRQRYANQALHAIRLGQMTAQVTAMLGTRGSVSTQSMSPVSLASSKDAPSTSSTGNNFIDTYIFQALGAQGVTPARATNDYEFIRRVTLDLTGRIPTVTAVRSFVADTTPNKRANLIETLLASPQWIDKWTMFYGDLFKNASSWPSIGTQLYTGGRDGFNTYIRNFLTNGTPYDQVARDLIASQGTNNYTQGELNWIINGRMTGGVIQDTWDMAAANAADTFLGISHMNCLLCHNGRGHLDTLSLWSGSFTRMQAWGFSGYMAHIALRAPAVDPTVKNGATYWYADDSGYKGDYPLNTTAGNRPPRQPVGTTKTVAPSYPFTGGKPPSGSNYRQQLAYQITGDFQFARAAVNYLWAYFFGMGLVDPPDQFDPARLDPNNPPPSPWTLQPSNPQLLNALAQDFIDNKYDVKHIIRLIVNSQTYQLSSDYDPTQWNPNWQSLFARKQVRRLWGEELMDSVALSSNIASNFTFDNGVKSSWAMQYPEPAKETSAFLAAFLPGDRDLNPRRPDGAIQQSLSLMNDSVVMSRLTSTSGGASLYGQALLVTNNTDVTTLLFMNILSRNPTAAELQSALSFLGSGNHTQKIQELMWSLYNKVDFIYNY